MSVSKRREESDTNRRDPILLQMFLCSIIIGWLHKLTISDQAYVTLQLIVRLSDLVWRFSASSALPGRGMAQKIFTGGPNPFSPALIIVQSNSFWFNENFIPYLKETGINIRKLN